MVESTMQLTIFHQPYSSRSAPSCFKLVPLVFHTMSISRAFRIQCDDISLNCPPLCLLRAGYVATYSSSISVALFHGPQNFHLIEVEELARTLDVDG